MSTWRSAVWSGPGSRGDDVCDHNSVLRPLRMLSETAGVKVSTFAAIPGLWSPDDVKGAIRPIPTGRRQSSFERHRSNPTDRRNRASGSTDRCAVLVDAARFTRARTLDVCERAVRIYSATQDTRDCWGRSAQDPLHPVRDQKVKVQPLRYGGTVPKAMKIANPMYCRKVRARQSQPGRFSGTCGRNDVFSKTNDRIDPRASHGSSRQLTDELSEIDGGHNLRPKVGHRSDQRREHHDRGYEPQELAAILIQLTASKTRAAFQCARECTKRCVPCRAEELCASAQDLRRRQRKLIDSDGITRSGQRLRSNSLGVRNGFMAQNLPWTKTAFVSMHGLRRLSARVPLALSGSTRRDCRAPPMK